MTEGPTGWGGGAWGTTALGIEATILLCIAVAETICAEDMPAIDWRARSRALWSCRQQAGVKTQVQGASKVRRGKNRCRGDSRQVQEVEGRGLQEV